MRVVQSTLLNIPTPVETNISHKLEPVTNLMCRMREYQYFPVEGPILSRCSRLVLREACRGPSSFVEYDILCRVCHKRFVDKTLAYFIVATDGCTGGLKDRGNRDSHCICAFDLANLPSLRT